MDGYDEEFWEAFRAGALDVAGGSDTDTTDEVTHACPPEDSGVMPCCNRTPFEVPLTDRMTLEPDLVTCPVDKPTP